MSYKLSTDCLNEIFKYLKDKVDLHSCLLVNHHWCEVSVPILWKNIQNYGTLIACLPNESKETLLKNEIIVSIPTSKSPSFNYVTFIKTLSIDQIIYGIEQITSIPNINKTILIMQEIFK